MKMRLKTANFTRDGNEYVLSCLFLISSPKIPEKNVKSLVARVRDVICMVSVKPAQDAGPAKTCLN